LSLAACRWCATTKGEYDLWQRRFWEHTVRDEADLAAHVEYIHFNPVKHGLVEQSQGLAVVVVSPVRAAGLAGRGLGRDFNRSGDPFAFDPRVARME
jgi:hypothetical protein